MNHNKIMMVDLKSQYLRIKSEIDLAIQNCIENTNFINGQQVKDFEQKLSTHYHSNYVVSCANGTDALQLALMSLDLQRGDEIIVPAFTYVASAEVIGLLQLTPVIVDVEPDTFNINAAIAAEGLSSKTRAIIPVHLFGQCVEMNSIMQLAHNEGIKVIEDTAQSIGASCKMTDGQSKYAGTIGDIGTTSFFPSKNLGCYGDGGAMFTQDENLATTLRMLANHGQSKKYYHEIIGTNSRLDTLQAAILLEKVKHIDQYNQARQAVAHFYDEALQSIQDIIIPFRNPLSTHVFNQYTIKVPAALRDKLKDFLHTKGIPSMIYYPLPLHKQSAFTKISKIIGGLPNSNAHCNSVLSLPIHTEMEESQLSYIVENMKAFFKNN
ncbi:DegT/DnrJ/EryC1/StrS family aminotransferase [Emticicia sp.]|uniref:DegT/DnrJ/EryC1/StrS family aminotransferase n=1 Tax=Emticicia sp. TaxID=1930953 RepID=UPI00375282F3